MREAGGFDLDRPERKNMRNKLAFEWSGMTKSPQEDA
jgi:hypothetical protein